MKDLKSDIVVIGSGAAGVAAALTAAQSGAKVILIEKNRAIGGISIFPSETFAIDSRIQRQHNIPLTKDEAFNIFMSATQWKADARLVRAVINESAETIDWLEGLGVKFELNTYFVYKESLLAAHTVDMPNHFGGMLKLMKSLLENLRGKILLSTQVKKIITDNNKITGVSAKGSSDKDISVTAKAVIIAGGGFPNNHEMVKKYGGFELGRDLSVLSPIKLNGDGIQMAWELGAASDGMSIALRYDMPSQAGHAARWDLTFIAHQPYLWINQDGERFFDEGTTSSGAYTANALVRQKNKYAYLIFDFATKRHMEENGWDNPMGFDSGKNTDIDGMLKKYIDQGDKNIFIVDSLVELAEKIEVNPNALEKTVDEYNGFCEKGHDDIFAKDPRFLLPVKHPKFYVFRIMPMAYGTVGGIKINEKTEVVNTEHNIIPGLYAAGDCANGAISHNFWLAFTLRGFPTSFALNTGGIAGRNAVKYIANGR